jgi:hydrogenase small subunit
VFIQTLRLVYHPTLSAGAGQTVVSTLRKLENYLLVVEGGVPTAFGGHLCLPWADQGKEVTFQEAIQDLASKANQVICVGTCAAFGGVSAMGDNPCGVRGVGNLTGKSTINVAGCPPHPNWIVATLVQALQGQTIAVDNWGRPLAIYGGEMCGRCPFHHRGEASDYGINGTCLERLGCHGRSASAPCPNLKWNNGVNWCVGAGAPCQGCTEPSYPSLARREGRGPRGERGRFGRPF